MPHRYGLWLGLGLAWLLCCSAQAEQTVASDSTQQDGYCLLPDSPWELKQIQCPAPGMPVIISNGSVKDIIPDIIEMQQASDRQDTNISIAEEEKESNQTSVVIAETPLNISSRPQSQILSYNFASPDCSARIHSSSKNTQHASSLLHKSRDRYMLTPCRSEHWVTIELCDEIRIEAIEISMWEFFSGIVREIKLGIGDDNIEVATFVTRNARGDQLFFLPEPTSFQRLLRLEFPSFYGSEYYCPISQVKVYGMDQMEAFKWEQKQSRDRDLPIQQTQDNNVGIDNETLESATIEKREIEKTFDEDEDQLNFTSLIFESTENVTTSPPQQTDSAESIYALIFRRLSSLESNQTTMASYLESGAHRLEKHWDEWRSRQDAESYAQRMRFEDRLGILISQLEQNRNAFLSLQDQVKNLADELSSERRRGVAQILVTVLLLTLGVMTRGEAVQSLLRPLLKPHTAPGTASRPSTPLKAASGATSAPFRWRKRHSLRSVSDWPSRHGNASRMSQQYRHLGRNAHLHTLEGEKKEYPNGAHSSADQEVLSSAMQLVNKPGDTRQDLDAIELSINEVNDQ